MGIQHYRPYEALLLGSHPSRFISPVGFHKIRCRQLKRAIIIGHQKKHKTLSYLSVLTVTGSQMCTTSAVCGSRGVESGSLLRRTSLLIQVKEVNHLKLRLRRHGDSFTIPLSVKCRRIWSSNLSTQLRRTQAETQSLLRYLLPWRTPGNRSIRSKSHQRRLHTAQCTKRHETFSKTMSVNGEHSRTWWVRYLVSWANLLLSNCCQRRLCL